MPCAQNPQPHADYHRNGRGYGDENDVFGGRFSNVVNQRFENVGVQYRMVACLVTGTLGSAQGRMDGDDFDADHADGLMADIARVFGALRALGIGAGDTGAGGVRESGATAGGDDGPAREGREQLKILLWLSHSV